jgi:hypothetical protein
MMLSRLKRGRLFPSRTHIAYLLIERTVLGTCRIGFLLIYSIKDRPVQIRSAPSSCPDP